jgi:hypothetical protein
MLRSHDTTIFALQHRMFNLPVVVEMRVSRDDLDDSTLSSNLTLCIRTEQTLLYTGHTSDAPPH